MRSHSFGDDLSRDCAIVLDTALGLTTGPLLLCWLDIETD
jgi:hypothetical protein